MKARIHHYVPKLYLRGFTFDAKRRKVHVVDAMSSRAYPTNIENVGAERDFNRLEIEGVEPDKLEVGFNKFETEVADAIAHVREVGHFRDPKARALILNLIGLMAIRNPRWRNAMNDFAARVAKMTMNLALETPERWAQQVAGAKAAGYMAADADANYAKMKAFHDGGQYKIEMPRERNIQLELSTHDKIVPYLFARNWSLLRAEPDAGKFITSDHPVCLMYTDPELQHGFYRPGFGVGKTEVLFPLSAELALVGSFEDEEREYASDIISVAHCNAAVIAFAERQVYAAEPDFPYLSRAPMPFARWEECIADGSFIRPRPEQGKGSIPTA